MDNVKKIVDTRRITTVALLTALSLITFLIENAFPPLFLPGAKMGLANIFSLFALIVYGKWDAYIIVIVRACLGCFIVGNPMALVYSLSAGIVSLTVCTLLMYFVFPKISLVAISIAGAVVHNITQNLVFCLVTNSTKILAYMPYLALIGVLSGAIVGLTTLYITKRIPLSVLRKN